MKGIPLTVKEQNEVEEAMDLDLSLDRLKDDGGKVGIVLDGTIIKTIPEITVRTTIPDPKNWRKK